MKKSLVKIPLSFMLASAVVFSAAAASFADEADNIIPEEEQAVFEGSEDEEVSETEDVSEEEAPVIEECEEEAVPEEEASEETMDISDEETEEVLAYGDIPINAFYFPDSNFREFIVTYCSIDDDNDILSREEQLAVIRLDIFDYCIEDLSGIEWFTNLEYLYAQDNDISSVNLSNNTKLKVVNLSGNPLTSLDVSTSPWLSMAYEYGSNVINSNKYSFYCMKPYTLEAFGLYIDNDVTFKKSSALGLGWKKSSNGKWWFKYPDGTYPTDLTQINGKYYAFGSDGYMITGWYETYGSWLYAGSDGAMVSGFQTINNKDYYFDPNSSAYHPGLSYLFCDGWLEIYDPIKVDSDYIFADENGVLASGWRKFEDDWVYFGSDHYAVSGFQTIDGKDYYFTSSYGYSIMISDDLIYTADDDVYYASKSGVIIKNKWKKIDSSWSYFGEDGKAVKGWKKIDGEWYYFFGITALTDTIEWIDGYYYCFDENGVMQKNCWGQIEDAWMYFGNNGKTVKGWKKIGNKWYYFDKQYFDMKTGLYEIDGEMYYFSPSGAMQTGWKNIKGTKYDHWYYFDKSGVMLTGWQKIDGKWYWFYDSGIMKTGWHLEYGDYYYLDDDGHMLCNESRVIYDTTFTFDSHGACSPSPEF